MRHRVPLVLMPILVLVSAPAPSQTLFGADSNGDVIQFSGPSDPSFCNYPLDGLAGQWSFLAGGGPCPAPGVPGGLLGDIAIERTTDRLWVTDGVTITRTSSFGSVNLGFTFAPGAAGLAGPATGMCHASNGDLWLTDGSSAASITPPALCNQPQTPAQAAFSLGLPTGVTATDIDLDPRNGSVWVCDDAGFVTNVLVGGGLGPFGRFAANPGGTCPLGTVLTGLAVDRAGPNGVVYLTDGLNVFRCQAPGGGPAQSTFYAPLPCQPYASPSGGTAFGLAMAAFPNIYGDATRVFFPSIGTTGQSILPNPNFQVQIGGTNNGDDAFLYMSFSSLCPAFPILGANIYVNPPISLLASRNMGNIPFASVNLPLPGNLPQGITVHLQWITFNTGTLVLESTRGLAFTTSFP